MGAEQSKSKGKDQEDGPLDYYELLQVDIEATPDEIKKSYRRLALINHPDKNPDRVEEATKLFADLQQAYEILSDPNERAFYDKHRNDHIEVNDDDLYDHVRAGDAGAKDSRSKFNRRRTGDPGIKLDQLMRFFDPKLARKFDDSNEGFYSIYRSLFNVLANDEVLHTPEGHAAVHYPTFGDSTTPWAPPPGMTKAERARSNWARDFYTAWGEFTTEKKFDWIEKWDLRRGEDRNVRRLMEKENKKLREEHRKEYIDTVRTLVGFIQNRDPRFKAYQAEQARLRKEKKAAGPAGIPGSGSGTSTPRGVRAADPEAARRRAEERARQAAEFEEQDWQKVKEDPLSDEELVDEYAEDGDGTGLRMDDGAGGEIFECVACNKTFQSEASWSNHERSKKHKQAVYRLAKEMRAEAGEWSDDDFVTPAASTPIEEDALSAEDDLEDEDEVEDDLAAQLEEMELKDAEDESLAQMIQEEEAKKSTAAKEEPVSLPKDLGQSVPASPDPKYKIISDDEDASTPGSQATKAPEMSKRDKRRAREARKKAEEEEKKAAAKEARKAAKKAPAAAAPPPPPPNKSDKSGGKFVQPKRKGDKGKGKKVEEKVITAQDVEKVVEEIMSLRSKMVDKWGEHWTDLVAKVREVYGDVGDIAVLCLGLGKPFGDRTAKIQLSFILEFAAGLGAPTSAIQAFDPVFEDGDVKLLKALGCEVMEDNLRGAHSLTEKPHLVYMPHCPKPLYESFLQTNFGPRLAESPRCILLGNDLGDYVPGFVREEPPKEGEEGQQKEEEEFTKPKKKRKGRGMAPPPPTDSVLRRLVPHFDVLMLSDLPETNLPGFARAFLSTGFQWVPSEKKDGVDWETPLPPVEWPEDGEVA